MKNLKKIVLIVALLGIIAMAGFAYFVYNSVFEPNTAFNNDEAHIYISTGARFSDVNDELRPLLENMISFEAVANRKGYPAQVKPGHYIIKKGMNNNDIVNTLRVGNTPIKIKFNNQERLQDLAGQLGSQVEADSTSLLTAMVDSTFLAKNDFNIDTALGMYVPNTYEVYWNISPEELVGRMLQEHDRFWTPHRLELARKQGLVQDQVIALAAIVQKETAKVEERPKVAGVYLNRIERGMPLQADPTIIYAKKRVENDFDQTIKRVLLKDLEIESPYNTYLNPGIPPGPIFMPDISSIDAVLNPQVHDYLFFVADIENFGYHKFAKTLSQHNRNARAYHRWVDAQGVQR